MKFTYVLDKWEETIPYSKILKDVLIKEDPLNILEVNLDLV